MGCWEVLLKPPQRLVQDLLCRDWGHRGCVIEIILPVSEVISISFLDQVYLLIGLELFDINLLFLRGFKSRLFADQFIHLTFETLKFRLQITHLALVLPSLVKIFIVLFLWEFQVSIRTIFCQLLSWAILRIVWMIKLFLHIISKLLIWRPWLLRGTSLISNEFSCTLIHINFFFVLNKTL